MRRTTIALTVIALLLAFAIVPPLSARASDEKAVIKDTPQQYLRGCISNSKKYMTGDKYTGDNWTWHTCHPMNGFIDSYLATRDTAWLDVAVEYFDWTISLLMTSPDGHKGWIGPAYRMQERLGEHPIGDGIMIEPMVRFAALVLKDEPALAAKYGKAANVYVELAEKQKFGKWIARGTWREDGSYGAFTVWPWTYTEEENERWREPPEGMSLITMPVNMQVHWGVTAARLHRITGKAQWRRMAEMIFNLAKSRLNLYDDHYSWNYWDPFGPWDIKANNPQDFNHWINPHPYVNYQLGEVSKFVAAFNHGITFDATDMKRFVRTNIHVMWNGSLEEIKWRNSDAAVQMAALGEVRPGTPKADGKFAGILWDSLVQFDATARKIYEKQLTPGLYQHAYYHNVTAKREPGYERRYGDVPQNVLNFPHNPCSTITMVTVIPSIIQRDKPAVIACQGRLGGDLKIELRSDDGERSLAVLHEGKLARVPFIYNHSWKAADVQPGRYRIRWALGGEYREFPVEIR